MKRISKYKLFKILHKLQKLTHTRAKNQLMDISNYDKEILSDFTGRGNELLYQKLCRLVTLKEIFCKVL